MAAARAEDVALRGRSRLRTRLDVPPEVDEPDEQRRVGWHDEEVVLVEVEMPGLDRSGLEQAPVPLDGPEVLDPLDGALAVDAGELREEPVGAARDGDLGQRHAGYREPRRVRLAGQPLPRVLAEEEISGGERASFHVRGILSSRRPLAPDPGRDRSRPESASRA
jgi:hypothetical protein